MDDAKDLAKKMKAIFQLTSAKTSEGINNLFDNIGKKYLQPSFEYDAGEKQAKENYEKKKQKRKAQELCLIKVMTIIIMKLKVEKEKKIKKDVVK